MNIRSGPLLDSQMHGRSERDKARSDDPHWDPLGGTVDPLDEFQEQDLEHELVGSQLTWILMIQAHEKPELFCILLIRTRLPRVSRLLRFSRVLRLLRLSRLPRLPRLPRV